MGAKASPPTVETTSSDFSAPLPVRANACLPADQATAFDGPTATWSIQRRLASVATVSLLPLASVATTLPSSPPVTTRPPSLADDRITPPWTATRCGSPSRAANSSASSPSTKTAVSLMK